MMKDVGLYVHDVCGRRPVVHLVSDADTFLRPMNPLIGIEYIYRLAGRVDGDSDVLQGLREPALVAVASKTVEHGCRNDLDCARDCYDRYVWVVWRQFH